MPAASASEGRPRLGPHVVGQRVVVRRLLRGRTGISGGAALTDVVGTCEAWADGVVSVRREDGTLARVPVADVVAGKPVPPRPPRRPRLAPADAHRRAVHMWPDLVTRPLGAWLLRASPTVTARRANSVLALDPAGAAAGPDPVGAVTDFYAGLGKRPIAALLPHSAEHAMFRRAGWVRESTEADTLFQLGSVPHLMRALDELPTYGVTVTEEGTHAVARVGDAATGRAAYADGWVGLRSIHVTPQRRRRGLGSAVLAALVEWGAERGARTAYLHVLADNTPAVAMYDQLGFVTHHAYRYLAAP